MKLLTNKSTKAFYDYARAEWVLLDDTGSLLNPKVLGRFKTKAEVLKFIK